MTQLSFIESHVATSVKFGATRVKSLSHADPSSGFSWRKKVTALWQEFQRLPRFLSYPWILKSEIDSGRMNPFRERRNRGPQCYSAPCIFTCGYKRTILCLNLLGTSIVVVYLEWASKFNLLLKWQISKVCRRLLSFTAHAESPSASRPPAGGPFWRCFSAFPMCWFCPSVRAHRSASQGR